MDKYKYFFNKYDITKEGIIIIGKNLIWVLPFFYVEGPLGPTETNRLSSILKKGGD